MLTVSGAALHPLTLQQARHYNVSLPAVRALHLHQKASFPLSFVVLFSLPFVAFPRCMFMPCGPKLNAPIATTRTEFTWRTPASCSRWPECRRSRCWSRWAHSRLRESAAKMPWVCCLRGDDRICKKKYLFNSEGLCRACRTVAAAAAALGGLADGERTTVKYRVLGQRGLDRVKPMTMDRRWHDMALLSCEDSTGVGRWNSTSCPPPPPPKPPPPATLWPPELPQGLSPAGADVAACLCKVRVEIAYQIDGVRLLFLQKQEQQGDTLYHPVASNCFA